MIKITKNYCCKECGGLICLLTAMYGSGLCLSCANSGKRNPMFGSTRLSGKNNPQYIDGRSILHKKCVDCNKPLSRNDANRCSRCHFLFSKKENHPNYQGGKPHCIDCGKQVSDYKSIRCQKCFIKYKKTHLKPTINYCCMDCGDLISLPTALNGNGRCNKCCRKGKNHPLFGSKMKPKSKNKISKALKGKYVGEKSPAYKDGRTLKNIIVNVEMKFHIIQNTVEVVYVRHAL